MSENHLEAVLWDLDGVIADTADYHYGAWREIFRRYHVDFRKEDFMRFFGRRHDTIIRFALGDGLSPEEFEAITEEKQEAYRRAVSKNTRALPGALKLIHQLNANGIKIALASSAPPENIDVILVGLKLENAFQAIASGLEVTESKPNPEVYRLAARKLGVAPGNCVVIEDAVSGVEGAKLAGMKCLAVTNSHPSSRLQKADLVVDSLEQVGVAELAALFI